MLGGLASTDPSFAYVRVQLVFARADFAYAFAGFAIKLCLVLPVCLVDCIVGIFPWLEVAGGCCRFSLFSVRTGRDSSGFLLVLA